MSAVTLLHSSDVHVDDGHVPAAWRGDPLGGLRLVLDGMREARADALLLAGDTFEHNRLADALLAAAAALIAEAGAPVVILPGNHDPAMPGSVFERMPAPRNLHVLGARGDQGLVLPGLPVELRGRAHRDHGDMAPLPAPAPRQAAWQVVLAHGHYVPERPEGRFLPSWLFDDADLSALGADYVALGHWNRHAAVGPAGIAACYSGSPDHAGTANLVCLSGAGVSVTRQALRL